MPYPRPDLATLIGRIGADLAADLGVPAPLLPVSNLAVLARVVAGAVHGLYGHLDWQAQQILPDTAEAAWLERHAALPGLYPVAATYAAGSVTVTGTAGSVLLLDTRVRRSDGAYYRTTAALTLSGTTGSVAVRADAAGEAGDTAAGVALTLVAPVSGISSSLVVGTDGLTGGADAEGTEALRARLMLRLAEPPAGGRAADYVAWALAAHPDVTRAWAYPEELGPGSVTVRVTTDAASADGIPAAPVITAVQAYIDGLRPVTAAPVVLAPIAAPLALTLAIVPDTTATRAAVTTAVSDLIRAGAVPGGVLRLRDLWIAIGGAAGVSDFTLTTPSADVSAGTGTISTPGTITWV